MSLILDALNRADRERKNSQPTPDINTVHEVSYHPGRSGRGAKLWILAGVIILVLAGLLIYLLLQTQTRQQAAPIPVSTPAPVPAVREATTPPALSPTDIAQSRAAAVESTAVKTPTETPVEKSAEVHSLYAQEEAPPVDDKVNDLYKPVEEPPVVKSVPVQVPAVTSVSLLDDSPEPVQTAPAPAEKGKRYDDVHHVPDLRQLPWGVQQQIPSIIYSQHNFTGDGASNVVLNGQARRPGNQVGGELNLEEIYVDGILLRFREHRFKLRAMNNWVNM